MVPVLVTSAVCPPGACRTSLLTSSATSPSPYMSSVWVTAPASTTVPSFAVMTPELATWGATKAASPACLMVIVPALSMRAVALPGWSNTSLPAMKFLLLMLEDETTRPAAFTCAPR